MVRNYFTSQNIEVIIFRYFWCLESSLLVMRLKNYLYICIVKNEVL